MAKRRFRVRKKRQNRIGMTLVLTVLLLMMLVVSYNTRQMKEKLAVYQQKERSLTEQLEAEKERSEEIEEFKKYTGTKKYIEETAREKLGLVYEDEILIKTEE